MRPGLLYIIFGATLFLLGIAAVPVMIVLPLLTAHGGTDGRIDAPGSGVVEIVEPGRHYLWHEFEGTADGRRRRTPEFLPTEWYITITDADDTELSLTPDTSVSVTSGTTRRRSLGYFSVETPSEITVEARGDGPPTVLTVSAFDFRALTRRFLSAFAIGFAASGAGIVFLIVGVARYARSGTKRSGGPPQKPPPPQDLLHDRLARYSGRRELDR
ncbi:MAG: hypothetical protein JJU00_19615 [Opitutales bacterium]|nr:hypothetical protein [Opitutales bacterium]